MRTNVTPNQIRAARALVGWSARELADASGVSLPTIQRFEGETVSTKPETIELLSVTLEGKGVEFIPSGVKLKAASGTKGAD